MKHRLLLAVVLGAALASPALAADPAPRTLSMTGHGEVRAAPDMATVNAGVTTGAPTAAAALSANSGRMNAIFAALKTLGVPEKNIQTIGFNVSPQYTNGDNNSPRRLTGYQINNEVSVRLEDVARVGAALDALVAAGANQMNGISFDIAAPAPLLQRARADAIADARARAEIYAKAAGVSLGAILSISEGGAVEAPRPMYRMMAMADARTPVAAGQQSVTADVSVVWEIH